MSDYNIFIQHMLRMCLAAAFFVLPVTSQTIKIGNYADLIKIGTDAAYPLNGDYELTADIDAGASKTENDGAGFVPIGSQSTPFKGRFNGNGHIISGLYINRPNSRNIGLFGWVDSAEIRRVGVIADTITGMTVVGALVGRADNSIIDSCDLSGVVISVSSHVGGLAGRTEGCTISRCGFSGFVQGSSYAGGLVGYMDGQMNNCYFSGSVEAAGMAGGLVGYAVGQIIECRSAGSVRSKYFGGAAIYDFTQIGGLIGHSAASVTKCSSAVSVGRHPDNASSTIVQIGGLIGYNTGTVAESRSTGSVEGTNLIGGLIGYNTGTVAESRSTGSITGSNRTGGLIGHNRGAVTGSSSSTGRVMGARGETGGLIGANEDGAVTRSYSNISVFGDSIVGGLIGGNYRGAVRECFYRTEIRIDTFNIGGIIINIVYNDSINGSGDKVGGLIGFNQGAITQSYAIGRVNGGAFVGGLIGWNAESSVRRCYSKGSVVGAGQEIGGLIGRVNGWSDSLIQCYSTSSVVGVAYLGGLVGRINSQNSRIIECYSVGSVKVAQGSSFTAVGGLVGYASSSNNVSRSYWAVDVSGQETSAGGGMGSDSASMRANRTFDGWDFTNVWRMEHGRSYPYFIYEAEPVSVFRDRLPSGNLSASAPVVTIKGRTLKIYAPVNTEFQMRIFDLRGRTVMRFAARGSGSFPLSKVPAGRYFIEIRKNGKKISITPFSI